MQFQLAANRPTAAMVAAAVHPLDPGARIAIDERRGVLEVMSTASASQVAFALQQIGYEVTPLENLVHISGGSTCCGGCA